MPQSLSAMYLHLVFSTKNRMPFFADPQVRHGAHAYLAEVSSRLDCPAIVVDGAADHVHILARFGRKITVAEWVKELKRVSSLHLKGRQPEFSWQSGYGVFSVDPLNLDRVSGYIRRQDEHHRRISFQDEFLALLREHDLEWDERYLWD